jgi:hypothetical protein
MHERLGHPGKLVFREMAMSGVVKGLHTTDVPCKECALNICETCVLGKQTRIPFGTANKDVKVTQPMGLPHMDTVGVISPVGRS